MQQHTLPVSDRRLFLERIAAVTASLGAAAAFGSAMAAPAHAAPQSASVDRWLDKLKGKYRQVFDAYAPNDGFPFAFAAGFLNTQSSSRDAGAVVVLRHGGFVLSLGDAVWAKYRVGETMKIIDPATKAPAQRNPFLRPKPGVLLTDDMAIDRLLARGVIFGVCNIALQVLSGQMAANAGVSAQVALTEWTEGLIPGMTVIPSGTWGVNRAQLAGCTYCAAG